jgi:KipI family sensor histidine kinase inhibitor
MSPEFFPLGDTAFIVRFGNAISVQTHKVLRAYKIKVEKANVCGVTAVVPAYTDLMVCYNPMVISFSDLVSELKKLYNETGQEAIEQSRIVKIPVLYGGEFGPDIEYVAKHNEISVKEVIRLHSSTKYLIYMLGFTPGFCYLGGLPQEIATPRKAVPRKKITAGSVGIAGMQTGIYPIDSPGGWQLIGRTPVEVFNINRKPEVLFEAGNYIQFVPVTKHEYDDILYRVHNNTYIPEEELIDVDNGES